jgi:RecB family exonuclease
VYAQHGARIERLRNTGLITPWNGAIEEPSVTRRIAEKLDEAYVWSPTQLEAYAKCPWAWFSARLLRVAKLEDPELDIDARARGTLYHDALHRFYDAARAHVQGPVFLRAQDADWAIPLLRTALSEAMVAAREDLWLGHPALRATKEDELRRELEKFISSEIALNEDMFDVRKHSKYRIVRTAVDAHELPFDNIALERDGVRLLLRGTIDRVEVGIDDRADTAHMIAAVDYKSSKYSAPGSGKPAAWDDAVVLQVPLYALALTLLRPGHAVVRTEYRAIRQCETVHPLNLYQIERRSNLLLPDAEARGKLEGALDAVAQHVRNARDGVYPAAPAPSCQCPDWCHAWEICRVKGGPKSAFDW